MKEDVLTSIKDEMIQAVERISEDTILETEKSMIRYFTMLHHIKELNMQYKTVDKEEKEGKEEMAPPTESHKYDFYRVPFVRNLRGGYLKDTTAFVPESIVRQLDIDHGDLINATLKQKRDEYSPDIYEYELAEKRNVDLPDRIEFKQAIVDYDENLSRYFVEKDVFNHFLKYDTYMVRLSLSDYDVNNYNLKKGDIVDVAYYASDVDTTRVIWLYHTEEDKPSTPKPSGYYKQKDKESKSYDPIFKDKHVIVVGFEPRKADMKEEVERRGGTFQWLSGKEKDLESHIIKADAVVLQLSHTAHRSSIDTVAHCKNNNIPVDSLQSYGRTSFVNKVDELLNN